MCTPCPSYLIYRYRAKFVMHLKGRIRASDVFDLTKPYGSAHLFWIGLRDDCDGRWSRRIRWVGAVMVRQKVTVLCLRAILQVHILQTHVPDNQFEFVVKNLAQWGGGSLWAHPISYRVRAAYLWNTRAVFRELEATRKTLLDSQAEPSALLP